MSSNQLYLHLPSAAGIHRSEGTLQAGIEAFHNILPEACNFIKAKTKKTEKEKTMSSQDNPKTPVSSSHPSPSIPVHRNSQEHNLTRTVPLEAQLRQLPHPRLLPVPLPRLPVLGELLDGLELALLVARGGQVILVEVDLAEEQHVLAADEEDAVEDVGIQAPLGHRCRGGAVVVGGCGGGGGWVRGKDALGG